MMNNQQQYCLNWRSYLQIFDIRPYIWKVARFLFENDLLNIFFLAVALMDISTTHQDSLLYQLKCWHAMIFGIFAVVKLVYRLMGPIMRFLIRKIKAKLRSPQMQRIVLYFQNLMQEFNEHLLATVGLPPLRQQRYPQQLEHPGLPPYYAESTPFMTQGPEFATPGQRLALHRLQIFRRFLVRTVLGELLSEIDYVNIALQNTGYVQYRLGSTSVDRFQIIVQQTDFVNETMPTLPTILKYLRLHQHQGFLVDRLRSLTMDSCMSMFDMPRLHSYGINLPTDSALIFHAFCLYVDSLLLKHPTHFERSLLVPGYRPFFENYVLMDYNMPNLSRLLMNYNGCGIFCTDFHSPRFDFVCANLWDPHNLPLCSYNVFEVIIELLLYVKIRSNSCLFGVDLREYELGRLFEF